MHVLGGYEHVQFQKAVMDKHAYRLNYVELDSSNITSC